MRHFIVANPGRTFIATWLVALAASGIGALSIHAGAPFETVAISLLGAWMAWALWIAIAIDDRLAGALGLAFAVALPMLLPFGMLQHRLSASPLYAAIVAVLGLGAAASAVLSGVRMSHARGARARRELSHAR